MKSFIAGKNESGQRLDKYLAKLLRNAPKSFIYKMLRKKNITLNDMRASGSEKLQPGDEIKLYFSDDTFDKFHGPQPGQENPVLAEGAGRIGDLSEGTFAENIIYEDEDLLFWNKPQGILSQPDRSGNKSVVEMLTDYLLSSGEYSLSDFTAFHPAPVNRLDRNTSGIVLCGKSLAGLQFLSQLIRDRDVRKQYVCVISGKLEDGVYSAWLRKDREKNLVTVSDRKIPGSSSITTVFRNRNKSGQYCVLEAELVTGRPHQIRAHLKSLGCSILGDPKYGDSALNLTVAKQYGIEHQMLHAESITFPEIRGSFRYLSGRTFYADLPEAFLQFLEVTESGPGEPNM